MSANKHWLLASRAAFALILLFPRIAHAHPSYRYIDLGPGLAMAINANGTIVGRSNGIAVAWHGSKSHSVGALPVGSAEAGSIAYGINANDAIIGTTGTFNVIPESPFTQSDAFVYLHGELKSLFTTPRSDRSGVTAGIGIQAFAINDRGIIVGVKGSTAFVHFDNQTVPLAAIGTAKKIGTTVATAVNAGDDVVGCFVGITASKSAFIRAFLWSHAPLGRPKPLPAALNGSCARGINNHGTVVGYSSSEIADSISDPGIALRDQDTGDFAAPRTDGTAMLWNDGRPRELPCLPKSHCAAFAVNDSDLVVGESGGRAVAWIDGKPVDLNSWLVPGVGWKLVSATAVNNGGVIVGIAMHGQMKHAFALMPMEH